MGLLGSGAGAISPAEGMKLGERGSSILTTMIMP